jgi:exodeoxyribonuclease X
MLIRCIDTETTGEKPDIRLVEVGWCNLIPIYHADESPHHWELDPPKSMLCDPGVPVSPEASAIHHITDAAVIGMPTPAEQLMIACDVPHDAVFAAHNADYDRDLVGRPDHAWIDTYKVAVHLAPMAPSFKLQALRYWLKLDLDVTLAFPAHRAGPDAYVTAKLLLRMLAKLSVGEMIDISNQPAFLPRFGFGKHRNVPIAEVPSGYLKWILDTDKPSEMFDDNVIHTAIMELSRR